MSENAVASDLYQVSIVAKQPTALGTLLHDPLIDFGCRPLIREGEGGSLEIIAFATQSKIAALRQTGNYAITVVRNASADGRARQKQVGQGNRFANGTTPRGFGEAIPERQP